MEKEEMEKDTSSEDDIHSSQNLKRCLPISDKNIVEKKKKKKTEEQTGENEKESTLDVDFFPSQDRNRNLHMCYGDNSSCSDKNYAEKKNKNETQAGFDDVDSE